MLIRRTACKAALWPCEMSTTSRPACCQLANLASVMKLRYNRFSCNKISSTTGHQHTVIRHQPDNVLSMKFMCKPSNMAQLWHRICRVEHMQSLCGCARRV
eukprot:349878-Chlamydomonas_euryale.AAC.7